MRLKKVKKISTPGKEVRKNLETVVRWWVEGATQTELANKLGISSAAINKWRKKPEWIEIENRLKEEKARVFMDSYTEETRQTFKKMQENAEKLAMAFSHDAASSLKIAKMAKEELLQKVESKKMSAIKASEQGVSASYHQKAAASSSREAREICEQYYGISKILEFMENEGLINETNNVQGEKSADNQYSDES